MIDLRDLEGLWYINRSNFPTWLRGDKVNPAFHYTILTKDEKPGLLDEVIYEQNGQIQNITGFDELVNPEKKEFVWRGEEGIMRFLKSKWRIMYFDPNKDWAIIHFRKTLFTPEGYDVISRYKNLNATFKKMVSRKQKQMRIEALLTPIYQGGFDET